MECLETGQIEGRIGACEVKRDSEPLLSETRFVQNPANAGTGRTKNRASMSFCLSNPGVPLLIG